LDYFEQKAMIDLIPTYLASNLWLSWAIRAMSEIPKSEQPALNTSGLKVKLALGKKPFD
jgi:hypothetical protein